MIELAKYSFANAKIRAMLSYLINPAQFNRLLEAKDFYEVLDILKETPYKDLVEKVDKEKIDLIPMEREFFRNDLNIYRKVYRILSSKREKDFVFILMQRYEIEELKVILRIWHRKMPVKLEDYILREKIIYDIDFKKILSSENIEEIILHLDDTTYKTPLLKAKNKFKERNSLFYLEAALDVDYYERLIKATEKFSSLDREIAKRVLGIEIDIENINWLIKLRKYYSLGMAEMLEWFIPGGEKIRKNTVRSFYTTNGLSQVVESVALGPYAKVKDLIEGNVHLIEGFLHEVLLREIKRTLAGFPFTIGTIMGYLILKHKETRNLVSLIYAKNYGLDKGAIVPLLNM
jgi:V/A-type H+-transporting ATPase subunit C